MALSEAMTTVMQAKRITRAELMDRLPDPTSRWAVYRVLSGQSRDPRLSTIVSICHALSVEPNRLMQLSGYYDGLDRGDLLITSKLHALLSAAESLDATSKDLAVSQIEAIILPLREIAADGKRNRRSLPLKATGRASVH